MMVVGRIEKKEEKEEEEEEEEEEGVAGPSIGGSSYHSLTG